jgi:predicted enzyme related to lactoylglutathione lyase
MAKVLGVGGVFFKSPDPEKLYQWYARVLGLEADPQSGVLFKPQDMPPNSMTVWSAFNASTDYFAPSTHEFMFNLIVDDVRGALQQVRDSGEGAQVVGQIAEYDFGKFGWFIDPDGNKVELWEPVPGAAPK